MLQHGLPRVAVLPHGRRLLVPALHRRIVLLERVEAVRDDGVAVRLERLGLRRRGRRVLACFERARATHAAPRHLFNERRYARLEALDECRHLRVDGRLLFENLRAW